MPAFGFLGSYALLFVPTLPPATFVAVTSGCYTVPSVDDPASVANSPRYAAHHRGPLVRTPTPPTSRLYPCPWLVVPPNWHQGCHQIGPCTGLVAPPS